MDAWSRREKKKKFYNVGSENSAYNNSEDQIHLYCHPLSDIFFKKPDVSDVYRTTGCVPSMHAYLNCRNAFVCMHLILKNT